MRKYIYITSVAAFLAYSIVILAKYSLSYPEILPLTDFAAFVWYVVGAKFLLILVLALSSYGFGCSVFGGWLPGFEFLLEEGLFKTFLGLIIISYAVFFLGLVGLLYPLTGYAVLAAGMALGVRDIKGFIGRVATAPRDFRVTLPAVILVSISVLFLLGGLYAALIPPTGFDVLMYHLGVPRMYLDAHRIFPTPDVNGSAFPFGIEMLYLLGMMAEGVISANMVNYSFAILGGLAAVVFARRFVKGASALLAFAIYISIPMVCWLMPQAYVELGMAAFTMLALHALYSYMETEEQGWLMVAAVLAGFTMAIKYTGAIIAFFFIAVIIANGLFLVKRGWKGAMKEVAIFAALAAAVSAPWYIKNALYYANPVYPLLQNIFGQGSSIIGESTSGYRTGGAGDMVLRHLASFWRTTLNAKDYQVGWSSALGPCLLMFIPGIFLFKRLEKALKYLLLFCLAYFLVIITVGNIRYLVPIMPALALVAAYPAGRLMKDELRAARAAGVALVAVFALAALLANTPWEKPASFPSSSPQATAAFYSGNQSGYLASYDTWQWINQNLPEDAVIYQLWDDASVYFRKRKALGFPLPWGGTGRHKLHRIEGVVGFGGYLPGEEIIANLKQMGATFLLINANREGHAIPEDPYFQAHTVMIRADRGVFLYEILP